MYLNVKNMQGRGYLGGSVINGDTRTLITRLAPNFNGVSQYATFTPITLQAGDFITLKAQSSTINNNKIIGSTGVDLTTFGIDSDGSVVVRTGGAWNVVGSVSNVGEVHDINISYDGVNLNVTVDSIAMTPVLCNDPTFSSVASSLGFSVGKLYNLKLNDGSDHNYPMDDGWTNNPTMRNTGTGADGTFINMTEASWVEVPA